MNRVSSIFSHISMEVPAPLFQLAVDAHRGERHARVFCCRDQFIGMLFCQLGQAKSLHEIEEGLMAREAKLRHLVMEKAPSHSTLAYANQHCPLEIYKTLSHSLWQSNGQACSGSTRPALGLPGKLMSLDSTVIDLCAKAFD
jgi:hypothetical protein